EALGQAPELQDRLGLLAHLRHRPRPVGWAKSRPRTGRYSPASLVILPTRKNLNLRPRGQDRARPASNDLARQAILPPLRQIIRRTGRAGSRGCRPAA